MMKISPRFQFFINAHKLATTQSHSSHVLANDTTFERRPVGFCTRSTASDYGCPPDDGEA